MSEADASWVKMPDGFVPPGTAKEMAAAAAALGEVVLKDHGKMDLSCIIMVDRAGYIGEVVFQIPNDAAGRARLLDMLASNMKRRGVLRYAFVTEAWTTHALASDLTEGDLPLPSEAPDRGEALMVSAQSETEAFAMLLPMMRDGDGRFLGLGRNVARDGETDTSGFGSLLRPLVEH